MSTENAIVLPDTNTSLAVDLDDLSGLGERKFLPYMSLVAKTAKLVDKGYRAGTWALTDGDKDKPEDLGSAFTVLIIDFRWKAMEMKGGKPSLINYDKKSEIFLDLMARAKTSKFGDDPSYLWGMEYLMWVYSAKNGLGTFTTWFANNESSRIEATNINSVFVQKDPADPTKRVKVPVQLRVASKLVPSKTPYFAPTTAPDSSIQSNQPTPEALAKALTIFRNPPVDNREVAPDTTGQRVR